MYRNTPHLSTTQVLTRATHGPPPITYRDCYYREILGPRAAKGWGRRLSRPSPSDISYVSKWNQGPLPASVFRERGECNSVYLGCKAFFMASLPFSWNTCVCVLKMMGNDQTLDSYGIYWYKLELWERGHKETDGDEAASDVRLALLGTPSFRHGKLQDFTVNQCYDFNGCFLTGCTKYLQKFIGHGTFGGE